MTPQVTHIIDDHSPLANWRTPGGMEQDADSEIVVVVSLCVPIGASG
jgi:hypothetical protein